MIAYLEGKITQKNPTSIYMDIGGIAYELNISLNTFSQIEELEQAKLFTHLHVKEDSHTLFGFFEEAEKEVFKLLVSVSGIGPNTARVILSYMTVSEVKSAILNENVAAFKKVKGVGPKTAKLIILDLKTKIAKTTLESTPIIGNNRSGIREEVAAALMALGFQKNKIDKQIDKILTEQTELTQVEAIIKAVLRQMS